MKYVLLFLMLLVIVLGCVSLGNGGSIVPSVRTIPDGIYDGVGSGYRGPIHVQVRVDSGNITEIEIIDSTEDRFVGGEAMEELLDLVILYNTTNLDAISGATESSKGFLEAVENAIIGSR